MCAFVSPSPSAQGCTASCEPPLLQLQLEVWDEAVVGSGGAGITRRSRGDAVRVEDTVIRLLETFLRNVGPY